MYVCTRTNIQITKYKYFVDFEPEHKKLLICSKITHIEYYTHKNTTESESCGGFFGLKRNDRGKKMRIFILFVPHGFSHFYSALHISKLKARKSSNYRQQNMPFYKMYDKRIRLWLIFHSVCPAENEFINFRIGSKNRFSCHNQPACSIYAKTTAKSLTMIGSAFFISFSLLRKHKIIVKHSNIR